VASHVITALQSVVSRNVDPLESAVVSVCSIKSGETFNVIPQTATLLGTVRTLTDEMRDLCEARIRAIVDNVCAAFGATATMEYNRGYPVTFNDAQKTEFMADVARKVSGDAAVDTTVLPLMGSEDFSFMLEKRPGAYIFLGNGDTAGVHHPAYDFNDEAAPYGVSLWAKIVEQGMPARA
jgi:hippurate hydrolase